MKLKEALKYIAIPSRLLMTLLTLMILLVFVQHISIEIIRMHSYFNIRRISTNQLEMSEEVMKWSKIARSDKRFLPDGTLHLIRPAEKTPGVLTSSSTQQIFDVNDNLIWEGPPDKLPYDYLPLSYINNRHGLIWLEMDRMQLLCPDSSRTLEIPVRTQEKVSQIWRYIYNKKVFVGYDSNGRIIGYTGPNGFAQSATKAGSFGDFVSSAAYCPYDSYSPTLLWETKHSIYQINFEQQKVELILDNPGSDLEEIIIQKWDSYIATDNAPNFREKTIDESKIEYRPMFYCRSKDGNYHLALKEPKQTITVKIPEQWNKLTQTYFHFSATRDKIFMTRNWMDLPAPPARYSGQNGEKWQKDFNSQPQKKRFIQLYSVNQKGDLNLLNQFNWLQPSFYWQPKDESRVIQLAEYFTATSPLAYRLIGNVFRGPMNRVASHRYKSDILTCLAQGIIELRPRKLLLNLILSTVMVVIVFLHAWPRRTSNATVVFWLVFTMLFNIAGMLTYLALNYTPAIKCASCGKQRGLNQDNCPQCNAPLPAPKREKLDLVLST